MFRAVVYLITSLVIFAIVRAILNVILQGFANLFGSAKPSPSQPGRKVVPAGGELKKDPVCGTFISASTALQKKVGGETYYFCSEDCRSKFRG